MISTSIGSNGILRLENVRDGLGKEHVAYRCKTCGVSDSSCICIECFDPKEHEGHEFRMYKSSSGGCCDCGDPWHGIRRDSVNGRESIERSRLCSTYSTRQGKKRYRVCNDFSCSISIGTM